MANYIGAYAVVPAHDANRAKDFYERMIGLPAAQDVGSGFIFDVNGSVIYLYETGSAGTGKHTILTLYVDDLRATVAELRSRGVKFEEYDFPGLKTKDGIADVGEELAAWFTDPEDNVVAIAQRVG